MRPLAPVHVPAPPTCPAPQISELEHQLARKMQELQLLQQQNQRLQDRARMLELVIRTRDEQVERLRRLREQLQAYHQQQRQQQQQQQQEDKGTASVLGGAAPGAGDADSVSVGSRPLQQHHAHHASDAQSNASSSSTQLAGQGCSAAAHPPGRAGTPASAPPADAAAAPPAPSSSKQLATSAMLEPLESLDAAALQAYTK